VTGVIVFLHTLDSSSIKWFCAVGKGISTVNNGFSVTLCMVFGCWFQVFLSRFPSDCIQRWLYSSCTLL